MREHEDMRAEAEKAIGKPVDSFTTEGVIEVKIKMGDLTVFETAPTGTPVQELLERVVTRYRMGTRDLS